MPNIRTKALLDTNIWSYIVDSGSQGRLLRVAGWSICEGFRPVLGLAGMAHREGSRPDTPLRHASNVRPGVEARTGLCACQAGAAGSLPILRGHRTQEAHRLNSHNGAFFLLTDARNRAILSIVGSGVVLGRLRGYGDDRRDHRQSLLRCWRWGD